MRWRQATFGLLAREDWGEGTAKGMTEPEPDQRHAWSPTKRQGRRGAWKQRCWQLAIAIVALVAWQYIPTFGAVSQAVPAISPFFLSSPTRVAIEIWHLLSATGDVTIWPYLGRTLGAAVVGTGAAVAVGLAAGLACGTSDFVYGVVRPYLAAFNAVPRVALVPLIVLIFGETPSADAVTAFLVVVFLVFYNALEGARNAPRETRESVRLLGASPRQTALGVRAPYAAAWAFASLPNAISFGLQGAVTAELFGGSAGLGQLLTTAVDTANASLTFAVVVIVGAVGFFLIRGSELVRQKMLPWWDAESA